MKKNLISQIITLLLFVALLLLGFRLAANKPLWNDEIYSQIASVENLSPLQMVMGHIGEGNTCPLFYLSQKLICSISQYRSPVEWQKGTSTWDFDRPVDRMVLRVGPVVATAAAISLIFFFFYRFYSRGAAFLSLFLSLSSTMLWQYWAEARPYSLWMLLTTLQLLIFLRIAVDQKHRRKWINALTAVHILLSLTVVLSLPQILLVSLFVWLYGMRDSWRVVLLLIVPTTIVLFYYLNSPHYPFGLIFSVEQYLRANISRDRFYIMGLFGLVIAAYCTMGKRRDHWITAAIMEGLPALWVTLGMILSALGIILIFKFRQGTVVQFPVTEKYLIFLTPVGIIGTTVFIDRIVSAIKNCWASLFLLSGIAFLILPRFIKVAADVLKQYPNFLN